MVKDLRSSDNGAMLIKSFFKWKDEDEDDLFGLKRLKWLHNTMYIE